MLSVLEGLHPEPGIKLVKELSDRTAAMMLKEVIDGLSSERKAVIVVKPDKKLLNELRNYLTYRGFKITLLTLASSGLSDSTRCMR